MIDFDKILWQSALLIVISIYIYFKFFASMAEDQPQGGHVDHYRIPKLPTFFRDDPELWFMQVESSFITSRITDPVTQAHTVIQFLDHDVAQVCKDLIIARPVPEDYYNKLKERIIANFASSAGSNLRKLLKGEVLTGGKPSLTLSRLQSLNSGSCSSDIVKSILLETLPPAVSGILAASDEKDLAALAKLADRIVEVSQASNQNICLVSDNVSNVNSLRQSHDNSDISELKILALVWRVLKM